MVFLQAQFFRESLLVCGFSAFVTGFADAGIHWGLAVRTGNDEGMPEGVADSGLVAARAYGSHVVETALRFK